MNPSDDDAAADGGAVPERKTQSPFETVADIDHSRRERFEMAVMEYVVAPGRILWNDWRARVGLLITLAFILVGTVGVRVTERPFAGETDVTEGMIGPFQTMAYPLGTDSLGRGIMRQLIHATPAMLEMMFVGAIFSVTMSVFWGVFAGYKGGSIDRFMMAVADVVMTIPGLPLVVVLAAILEPSSPWMIGIVIVINAWAGFARSLRSEVLKLRHESYVEASRTIGISSPAIITKDILPNIMPLIVVNFVTTARNVIMASVGLYFLGLLPQTGYNWGVMLNDAYGQGAVYTPGLFYWFYAPMITIIILSLGLLLLGQGLDRIFNPRIRARHIEKDDGVDEGTDGEDDVDTLQQQVQGGL